MGQANTSKFVYFQSYYIFRKRIKKIPTKSWDCVYQLFKIIRKDIRKSQIRE